MSACRRVYPNALHVFGSTRSGHESALGQELPLASAEKWLFRLDRGGALDALARAADRKRSILPSSTLIAMSSAGSYQGV